MFSWVLLLIAGLCEAWWALSLKDSQGLSRLWPSISALVGMTFSVGLLTVALKHLPVGTAYAVWTGIGAVATVIAGILLRHDPCHAAQLICIFLIVAGVAGLKFFSAQ